MCVRVCELFSVNNPLHRLSVAVFWVIVSDCGCEYMSLRKELPIAYGHAKA